VRNEKVLADTAVIPGNAVQSITRARDNPPIRLDKGKSPLTPRQFLQNVLSIALPRDTNLITLSVVLPNAQLAADVAN